MHNRIAVVSFFCLLAPGLAAAESRVSPERATGSPAAALLPDFSALAEQLVPAVVSIQVDQKVVPGRGPQMSPEFFFGPDVPREFHNRGLGSGFFISKDGLILTNFHVVENAERIEVTFSTKDGSEKTLAAKVLGTAPDYDVALIQTAGITDAPIAQLGDSDAVRIGQWVMAIGNPFGLSHSVSVGIISAKERRDIAPSGRVGLYNFLQTDASINPGNSGGPLINTRGEVIGINSAINSAGSGIGFAIPMNMVKAMLPDLKSKGKFARSWMGIRVQPLTPELAQSYGLTQVAGALVADVIATGPAGEAGMKDGDVILEFDGKPVRNSSDLPLFASMAGVGKKVAVKLWRGGRELTVNLKLAEFPNEEEKVASAQPDDGSGLGLVVADITPTLQRELELEQAQGVVVKGVDPDGPAARAGLAPGDVIRSVNGQNIAKARDLKQIVEKTEAGGLLRLQVQRQGARRFIALRKPGK